MPVLSPSISLRTGAAEGPPEAGLRRELSRTAWEPGPLVLRQKLI
jgi:hypothetical protein